MYGGKIFKNAEHMQRLLDSAKMLDMDVDTPVETLVKAAEDTCTKNNLTNAYIRPLIWRGSEAMGINAKLALPHIAIAAWDWGKYFTDPDKGISLVTAKWKKAPPDCVPFASKCGGLYVTNSLNKHYALDQGYDDVLVLDWRGQVAESSGANIFALIDGVLKTPIADCFLNGITRQTIIQLAKDNDIMVEECVLFPADLDKASEIFVTGTAAEVTAVRQINEKNYEVNGEITKRMQALYFEATQS